MSPLVLSSVNLAEQRFRALGQRPEVVPKLVWWQAGRARVPVLLAGLEVAQLQSLSEHPTPHIPAAHLGAPYTQQQETEKFSSGSSATVQLWVKLKKNQPPLAGNNTSVLSFDIFSQWWDELYFYSTRTYLSCNVETTLVLLLAFSTLWSLTSTSPNDITKRCEESIMQKIKHH